MNEFGVVPDSFFLPQSRFFVVSPVVWVLLQAVDERSAVAADFGKNL